LGWRTRACRAPRQGRAVADDHICADADAREPHRDGLDLARTERRSSDPHSLGQQPRTSDAGLRRNARGDSALLRVAGVFAGGGRSEQASLRFEPAHAGARRGVRYAPDRKSTRLNSSHVKISYAVFCLKKKKEKITTKDVEP